MTNYLLDMMEKRRVSEDKIEYRNLDKDIWKAIKKAKTEWFEEEWEKIEDLEKKYDTSNYHQKFKQTQKTCMLKVGYHNSYCEQATAGRNFEKIHRGHLSGWQKPKKNA